MKEFNIGDEKNGFKMILPTSLNEITNDYLLDVTENIIVGEYHAIVACIYRCKILEIISSHKKSKALSTAIVPIFVKANAGTDHQILFDKIATGDKIIIAGTDIERGYHLTCPKNFITIENIIRIYNSDSKFAKESMIDQNYYYFVDFKLVPITDIKGYYDKTSKDIVNPFIIKNTEPVN